MTRSPQTMGFEDSAATTICGRRCSLTGDAQRTREDDWGEKWVAERWRPDTVMALTSREQQQPRSPSRPGLLRSWESVSGLSVKSRGFSGFIPDSLERSVLEPVRVSANPR